MNTWHGETVLRLAGRYAACNKQGRRSAPVCFIKARYSSQANLKDKPRNQHHSDNQAQGL